MKCQGKFMVRQVTPGKKNPAITYYSLVDMETGGLFSFSMNGFLEGVKGGELVDIDATFTPNQYGMNQSLAYTGGHIGKGTLKA